MDPKPSIFMIQESFASTIKDIIVSKTAAGVECSAVDVIKIIIEKAETLKGLSGKEKKEVVLQTLKDVTILSTLPVEVTTNLAYMLNNNIIDGMIDVVIDASNGKLEINQETVQGCLSCLIPKIFEFFNKK